MDDYPSTAKRRDLRTPLRAESQCGDGARPRFLGYAANLSETGVFINCMNPRPEGTRVRVVLHMPGLSQRRFSSIAEVCWTRGYGGSEGHPAGMGLRFVDLETGVKSMLRVFCARQAPIRFGHVKH